MQKTGSQSRPCQGAPRENRTFWSQLAKEQQYLVKRVADKRHYAPNSVLMRADEAGSWIGILTRGQVRVTGHGADQQRVIAHRHAGDLIGELATVGVSKRSATITAITSVGVLAITDEQLRRITDRYPQILRVMLAVLSDRMIEADRYRIELDTEASVKVSRALVEAALRTGHHTEQGLVVDIVSQDDFGSIIGSSRKTVVRVLGSLRRAGLLSTCRGAITVHDLDRLRDIAKLS